MILAEVPFVARKISKNLFIRQMIIKTSAFVDKLWLAIASGIKVTKDPPLDRNIK